MAALPNAKKFPKFEDFVPAKETAARPKRRQTVEEQVAIARAWTAAVSNKSR